MEKLILRYALPGIPLSIILFLCENTYDSQHNFMDVNNGLLFILLTVMFGHIIQQIWMYIFDKGSLSYNSNKRALLISMNEYYSKNKRKKPEEGELYAKWVTWLFSKAPQPIREKNRGNWNNYHTLSANSLGFGIAAIISLIILCTEVPQEYREVFCISFLIFILSSILLYYKSIQTKKLIEIQEKYLFKKFWYQILW